MGVVIFTKDGRSYGAADASGAVDQMRLDGILTASETLPQYMAGVAGRLWALHAKKVRVDRPENFLADLVAADVITLGETQ